MRPSRHLHPMALERTRAVCLWQMPICPERESDRECARMGISCVGAGVHACMCVCLCVGVCGCVCVFVRACVCRWASATEPCGKQQMYSVTYCIVSIFSYTCSCSCIHWRACLRVFIAIFRYVCYLNGKSDLFTWQKRPSEISIPELCISVNVDLLMWQKRHENTSIPEIPCLT